MLNKFQNICIIHSISIASILLILNCAFPNLCGCLFAIVGNCVLLLTVIIVTFFWTKKRYLVERVRPENKAVLITGCNSGFGFQLAKHLDSRGYHVFATGLKSSAPDILRLKSECSARLHILELDVTKDESVQKAYEFVKSKLLWLNFWAVVNNAGVLKSKRVDFSSVQDYQNSLEVNCLGTIRVTKAFLPLIRKSKGRIINVTSFAGRIAFPGMSPYVTSKFADIGFNDSLRHELNIWGVPVISIEPDFFRTNLINPETTDNLVDTMVSTLDENIIEDYGKEYFEEHKKYLRALVRNASNDIQLVIDSIDSAVSLVYPDVVYRPCGSFYNKILIHLYEILSTNSQNTLMKILMRGSLKPKRVKQIWKKDN